MDIKDGDYYRSLKECDDGTAEQIFEQSISHQIDPLVLSLMTSIGSIKKMTETAIKVIRACDYLGAEVPKLWIKNLYVWIHEIKEEELRELVNEYGENEIGLAISKTKKVKNGFDDTTLNELKRKYARHVITCYKYDFDNPETVFIVEDHHCDREDEHYDYEDGPEPFVVPKRWVNVRKIINEEHRMELRLKSTFPKLQYVKSDKFVTTVDQPSLEVLDTDKYPHEESVQLPSLRILTGLCWRDRMTITELHPNLEVCDIYDPELMPNLRVFLGNDHRSDIPDHIVKFVMTSDVLGLNRIRDHIKRYFLSDLSVTDDDRPLKFYYCTFKHNGHRISVDEAKKLMPNAIFVG